MKGPVPQSDHDRKLLANIKRVGWAVMGILESKEGPTFSFSIGLYRRFKHPEVIVVGLPIELCHSVINTIGTNVEKGGRFEPGELYEGYLEGYSLACEEVERVNYKEYLGTAGWFYQGWDFPTLQMVWPDRSGAYRGTRATPRFHLSPANSEWENLNRSD